METKWTPGPWHIDRTCDPESLEIRDTTEPQAGRLIAAAFPMNVAHEANARLIAAAPEMAAFVARIADKGAAMEMAPADFRDARALLQRIRGEGV